MNQAEGRNRVETERPVLTCLHIDGLSVPLHPSSKSLEAADGGEEGAWFCVNDLGF